MKSPSIRSYLSTQAYHVKGTIEGLSISICIGLCGETWRDMAAEQGEQSSSDVEETDGDSQQDVPLLWPNSKETLETVGSQNNSWRFL